MKTSEVIHLQFDRLIMNICELCPSVRKTIDIYFLVESEYEFFNLSYFSSKYKCRQGRKIVTWDYFGVLAYVLNVFRLGLVTGMDLENNRTGGTAAHFQLNSWFCDAPYCFYMEI